MTRLKAKSKSIIKITSGMLRTLFKKAVVLMLSAALLCGCENASTVNTSGTAPDTSPAVEAFQPATEDSTTLTTSEEQKSTEPETDITSESAADTVLPQENPSVKLLCAGDNLIHSSIYRQAAERAGGNGYDFTPAYENVAELIAAADLAILNQETIISDDFEPSNYPMFCSPTALGDHMVDIGFDAFSISNNHVVDKGERGLISTLAYWHEKHPDKIVYGASMKDEEKIPVLEVNGITFAFLGFMEHTNGLYLPKDTSVKITYLSQTEEVERQVREADKLADCVIVSVHYGIEVSNIVTRDQLDVTRNLVDWGADIIIGTQPHTVQPMEFVDKPDGGQAFVFYCLGNFISSMKNPLSMVEYLGRLTVTKELSTGEIIISDPDPVPLINHCTNGLWNIKIYLWSDYSTDLAAVHGCPGFTYSLAEKLIDEQIRLVDLLD